MGYTIYDHFYSEIDEDPFETAEDATQYALDNLPSDDLPYMIGGDDAIVAFVFQGNVYTISR